MIDTIPPPDASLPQFLVARARHASDGRLALDVIVGVAGAVGANYWHGPGWLLAASAATCLMSFGAWGIADRELGERPAGTPVALVWAFRAARIAATVLGVAAATLLAVGAMGFALGLMIS
jgi:hypothetical protein